MSSIAAAPSTRPALKQFDKLSQFVAEWAVKTCYEDVSAQAIAATATFIVDHFGVVLAGTRKQSSQIIREACSAWAPTGGGATVVGTKLRNSAPFAALINGTTGHALGEAAAKRSYSLVSEVVKAPDLAEIASALRTK